MNESTVVGRPPQPQADGGTVAQDPPRRKSPRIAASVNRLRPRRTDPRIKPDFQPHRSRLYENLAPAYAAVWPALSRRRIQGNIERLNIAPGAEVLEVGVGTGMSLEGYPLHCHITGVDLSESMLAEAQVKIRRRGWSHVAVRPMNAEVLEFEDESFDVVTSFHTISVVSDPAKAMREMVRVCRPGGTLLIINHFRSDREWVAKVIDSAGSLTKRFGWRTDLHLDRLVTELPIEVQASTKDHPLSLFTVFRAVKQD